MSISKENNTCTFTNIYQVLTNYANILDGMTTPKNVREYIRLRNTAKERLQNEASDTAYLHAGFVLDSLVCSSEESIDLIGWEILYSDLHEITKIPLSIIRALSFKLTLDIMNDVLSCSVSKEELEESETALVCVAFECVNMGHWDLKDAQAFSKKTNVPIFDKKEWLVGLEEHYDDSIIEDMSDMNIPKGGEDVYLL